MMWFRRIFLFLMVNILVVTTLSFILHFLGVGPYLTARGIDYNNLMAFCLVWGMGGSIISLMMSRMMAKWMMGVQVIDPNTRDSQRRALVDRVYQLARAAHLSAMPEVGIYQSPELNAFATGPSQSMALVAVSTGLLDRMSDHEVDGVLAHEISHIANGDMVTMTLLQGIINAFAMFLSRAIAFAISMRGGRDEDDRVEHSPWMAFAIQTVLEIVFMILGSIVIAWFSRFREYRADAGGARLAGRNNMIAALQALKRHHEPSVEATADSFANFKISGKGNGLLALFASHPPLDDRIARLSKIF
jgi:heat shock protein HtpX